VSRPGAKVGNAPRRNDDDVEVGARYSVIVSLPAWLMECLCCRRGADESRERHGAQRPELHWHGLLFFV
jgi:hypothetical protein